MDARYKAAHAKRLLEDSLLLEVREDAERSLYQRVVHGETSEEREDARMRLLGINEIVSRLEYLTSELHMEIEDEEDADTE